MLATFTIKNIEIYIKTLLNFFVKLVLFVLFGMKGKLSTSMMKKNPTSDVIEEC